MTKGLLNFGIVIEGEFVRSIAIDSSFSLSYSCNFPIAGPGNLQSLWIKSLNLICISESNQTTATNYVHGRTIIFPDATEVVGSGSTKTLTTRGVVDLKKILDRKWLPDVYYVQMAARQFHSNIVKISIEQ